MIKFNLEWNKWDRNPISDEKLAINVEVPTHTLASSPITKSVGTINEPPPLPIKPTKKPKTEPTENPKNSFAFREEIFFLGLYPEMANKPAKNVNKENNKIIGLGESLKFTNAPKGANIIIDKANGKAILKSTNLFLT